MRAIAPVVSPEIVRPALVEPRLPKTAADDAKLRQTFDNFVGEVFFGQMLKAMRSTVGKAAYFHGGQAEEIFSGQLDQVLSEKMAKVEGHGFTDAMYELFKLPRP